MRAPWLVTPLVAALFACSAVPASARPAGARIALTGLERGDPGERQVLRLDMQNTGTVVLNPSMRVVVADAHGRSAFGQRLAMPIFYPGTGLRYPIIVEGHSLPLGTYTLTAFVGYGRRTERLAARFTIRGEGGVERVFDVHPLDPIVRPAHFAAPRSGGRLAGRFVTVGIVGIFVLIGVGGIALLRVRFPALR